MFANNYLWMKFVWIEKGGKNKNKNKKKFISNFQAVKKLKENYKIFVEVVQYIKKNNKLCNTNWLINVKMCILKSERHMDEFCNWQFKRHHHQ